jgi:rubrerythrin
MRRVTVHKTNGVMDAGGRAGPEKCPACGKAVEGSSKACPACGTGIDPGQVRQT